MSNIIGGNIRLFLARHGNTFNAGDKVTMVGAKTDLPLTQTGHQQAKNLANYFAKNNITFNQVYCGPLARQQETAHYIQNNVQNNAQNKKTAPIITPALSEVDFGPWEGLTDDEITAKWPDEFAGWSAGGIWPEAVFNMRFEEKQMLIKNWLRELRELSQADQTGTDITPYTVLGVSSNGVIRLFLSLIPQVWEVMRKNNTFKNYKVKTGHFCELLIKPDNTIEIVRWDQGV